MAQKIHLAFLWHQHQPFYKDLATGQAVMPWVRLHATKDYYDMAAILEEFPNVRLTINLVPSLVLQLQDYAEGRCSDAWLEKTLLPAEALSEKDKCWILENFFFCNWDNMIFPNRRYAELFERRGKFATRKEIERTKNYFTAQDFLDLQVWFNLAWMDPLWQEKDPLVSHLYKKGRQFTESEKTMLVEKQKEICRLTIEKHKELWHKGQIEISTTPFYHPILPLLCDTDSGQMAMPGSLKPKRRFQHPEDARLQVETALAFMEKVFGRRPAGMWPSEGSVSEEAVRILASSGVEWAATDEGVLFNSLKLMTGEFPKERPILYHPYSLELAAEGGPKPLQMVFRDHSLSDAIGFVYARMDPRRAVDDFLGHITRIGDAVPESEGPALVPIILDGENCWEAYTRDGHDFLKALYGALSGHPRITTTTVGDFIRAHPAKRKLTKLWSGSWIGSNFAIWIGHPEDNRAWDLLSETRDFLLETERAHPELAAGPKMELARQSLQVAEGSDWCWWYGDQNSTAHDEVFDELFRKHLKNVYTFLGEEPPEKLNLAIKGKRQVGQLLPPLGLLSPKIDGLVTSYYEWRTGGTFLPVAAGGTMHQAEHILAALYYGFDLENLYLRLDTKTPLRELDLNEIKVKVGFLDPAEHELQISWQGFQPNSGQDITACIKAIYLNEQGETTTLRQIAAKKIIEFAIPFALLKKQPNEPVEFMVAFLKQGVETERWPYQSSLHFKRPAEDFGADFWSV